MTTLIVTSTIDSQIHNNIMAAGLRDRPPMLATGRYAQWRSRFLQYIDTRPNGDALRKCILKGPYTSTIVTTLAAPATEDSPAVPEQTTCRLRNVGKPTKRLLNKNGQDADPLALVAAAQTLQDLITKHQTSQSYAPHQKASLPTRSHVTTDTKAMTIAKPITPPFESASKEDSDPEQAQRDKDMQKNLALIAKLLQLTIQTYNNNLEFLKHQKQECGNSKSNSVSVAYTDEEMMTELEAHYSYMAKIQEVPNADSGTDVEPLEQVQYDTDDNVFANDIQHFDQSESISNTCAVETGDSNVTPDSPDMCDNNIQDDQNDVECDDERVALANLIANLKLDVDENKKIQKQLMKKHNATLTQGN
ncbi:hypothetical protein Tco_0250640 [Tanacetum coccineum]